DPNSVDEKLAIRILGLPRLVGMHPDTGKEIRASVGRFGPYVVHEKDFRSLKKEDSVLDVNLDRALELFAMPKGKGRRSAVVRAMGEHPVTKSPVEILDGPYGLYVKHEKTNATIPKDRKPEELTMEEAVKLLAEREEQSPSKPKRGGGKAAKAPKASPKAAKLDKAPPAEKTKVAAKPKKAKSSGATKSALSPQDKESAKLAKEIEKLRKENEKLRGQATQGKQST
ncbi:MAG: topoisomerase C-terminal repeat-containing protein, partial [Bdellovibrionota bacterium]